MPDIDLDAIEARANAASDGPWIVVHEPAWEADDVQHPDVIRVGAPLFVGDDEPVTICLVSTDYEDDPVDVLGDAEFIAHARTDIPALVAEVRRLRERAEVHAVTVQQAVAVERQRDEARAEAQRATAWHMEALDDLARAVCALDTSKAIASERRARVNRLVEAVERERAERLALTALLNAKQSWIDGAKVDMAAMEEELAKALAAIAPTLKALDGE